MIMDHEFAALFRDLAEQGFTIKDGLLPPDLINDLYQEGLRGWREGRYTEARIGTAARPQRISTLRGDSIQWLEPHEGDTAQQRFLDWTETLRRQLNHDFYLGLQRSEFHFARYADGHGYTRHIDQHRGQPHRRITLILYLTPGRMPGDGGELCLYHPDEPEREWLRIEPERGRLVLFRSELLPHAVLPARRARWSVTGWFRDDAVLLNAA